MRLMRLPGSGFCWQTARTIAGGELAKLSAGPGEQEEFAIDLPEVSSENNGERILRIRFSLAEDRSWAPSGHVVAWNEFVLTPSADQQAETPPPGPQTTSEDAEFVTVGWGSSQARFRRDSGALVSWEVRGRELLAAPLTPNFWRASTDNDTRGRRLEETPQSPWRQALATAKLTQFSAASNGGGTVVVASRYRLDDVQATLDLRYRFLTDDSMRLEAEVGREQDPPRRRGLACNWACRRATIGSSTMDAGRTRTTGIGGPARRLGVYESPVADLAYDYAYPQENGNRCDCRWVEFRSDAGPMLRIEGDPTIDFSAWPYTLSTLEERHTPDLTPAGYTTVNIDYRQQGVGGDDSWTHRATPMEKYQLTETRYRFSMVLRTQEVDEKDAGDRPRGIR